MFRDAATSRELQSRLAANAVGTQKLQTASTLMPEFPSIPYPPIEKLGLIGDRRTAALVAADGTLAWLCLPNYDGMVVFGGLLDATLGGGWKLGPKSRHFGRQRYVSNGPILQTIWTDSDGSLELLDFMPLPQSDRKPADESRRVVVRRLRCTRGTVACRMVVQPRDNFARALKVASHTAQTVVFDAPTSLGFWCSKSMKLRADRVEDEFTLAAPEEIWCIFGPNEHRAQWTSQAAAEMLLATIEYWNRWTAGIHFAGARRSQILRSAMLVHLLTFAPTGALIASPTMSLPERIGGAKNYDYRYTWIRDSSLGLGLLAALGLTTDAKRFMDWLSGLEASGGRSLQVLYTIEGGRETPVVEHAEVAGYRRSRPVRSGNAAVSMSELDSYGYLADCFLTYLHHGGDWEPQYWILVRHLADYTAAHWREPGSSIWELQPKRHFVASKVMSAVTLDRAVKIAMRTGEKGCFVGNWRKVRDEILAEVMTRGWSESLDAFRQHYDADTVDAAALLIPIMNLLPARHPRVGSTIARLIDHLDVNGFLHRFIHTRTVDSTVETIGDEEGAFLMCSFWLAQVLAQRTEVEKADAILQRAEAIAGDIGLFPEAVDARSGTFLGNTPLVFSQVEYARAAIALDATRQDTMSGVAAADKRT
jgi:alpha,alpha-trehalase